MSLTASLSSVTAADGTFSASGLAAWATVTGRTVTLSGIASAAQGGTGLDTSASSGLATVSGGSWTINAVGTGVLTALGVNIGSAGAFVVNGGALGTPSSGTLTHVTGLPEAGLSLTDVTTANVSATAHGFAPKFPNNTTTFLRGDGTYAAPTASVTWDTITAAAGSATTANGNNTIVYNTAHTSDSSVSWTFGETSAATNGTSTSGVPNQYLVKFATLANSTQSAAGFYSRGNHVFSISPTTTQILAGAGTQAAPIFSCTGLTGSGLWFEPGNSAVVLGVENVKYIYMNASQVTIAPAGSVSSPSFTDYTNGTTGCFWGSHFMAIVDSTSHEIMRFVGGTASVPYTTRQACAFANLPAAANGSEIYCSDCDPAALINTACASAGAKTGSMAARINGQWICYT